MQEELVLFLDQQTEEQADLAAKVATGWAPPISKQDYELAIILSREASEPIPDNRSADQIDWFAAHFQRVEFGVFNPSFEQEMEQRELELWSARSFRRGAKLVSLGMIRPE